MTETGIVQRIAATFEEKAEAIASLAPGTNDEQRDEFVRRVKTQVLRMVGESEHLQRCKPSTVLIETMKGVELGLDFAPQSGQAYLVPFKGAATLIIGYRGMVTLAARAGFTVKADVIYSADEFTWVDGPTLDWRHSKKMTDRGSRVGAYAVFTSDDGRQIGKLLTAEDVQKVKEASPGARQRGGPWSTHEDAMWLKTAIRAGFKLIPGDSPWIRKVDEYDGESVRIVADSPAMNARSEDGDGMGGASRTDEVLAQLGPPEGESLPESFPPEDPTPTPDTDAPTDAPADLQPLTVREAWTAYLNWFNGDEQAATQSWRENMAELFPGKRRDELSGEDLARLAQAAGAPLSS